MEGIETLDAIIKKKMEEVQNEIRALEVQVYFVDRACSILSNEDVVRQFFANYANIFRETRNNEAHLIDRSDWYERVDIAINSYHDSLEDEARLLFSSLRMKKPSHLQEEHYDLDSMLERIERLVRPDHVPPTKGPILRHVYLSSLAHSLSWKIRRRKDRGESSQRESESIFKRKEKGRGK